MGIEAAECDVGPMTLSVLLRHRFPGLDLNVAFDVPSPGIAVLFGHSGAGKTTILAAAAGLLRPDTCRITLNGEVLADTNARAWLPPEHRRVGLVFQDARLFPHMSVATNLRFGMRRAPPGPIRFDEVVTLLGIGELLGRRPQTLSGGERQRVAIGRALLSQPRLLLMDEPLANLDRGRKAEIMPYLARLKSVSNLPILYVTHALEEVAELADTLVLLRAGRVIASGAVSEVVARADLPLAQRDDAGAFLQCRVLGHDAQRHLTLLDGAGTSFLVPLRDTPAGAALRIRIPAREVILAVKVPESISVNNIISGTVGRIAEDTRHHARLVEVELPNGTLLSRVTQDAVARLGLLPGRPVLALVKSTAIEVLQGESQLQSSASPPR
jgi:molybdate transport system ATP-binding protein